MSQEWIQTHSGLRFYPLAPRVEDIRIEDIAWALPHICRFTGHTSRFYSVGEHSVHVASHVWHETHDLPTTLSALLHDASEAYLCDIARPVKHTPEMRPYREAETRLEEAIASRFGLPRVMHPIIKHHDERALMTERRDLVPNAHMTGWTGCAAAPWDDVDLTRAIPIDHVRSYFLDMFEACGGRR